MDDHLYELDEHTYKIIELVGTSGESIEAAIQAALARASGSLHNLKWFEVVQTRGVIKDGHVEHYQVRIKVGFRLGAAEFSAMDLPEPGTDPLHEGP